MMEPALLSKRLTHVHKLRKQSEAASLRLSNRVHYLAREEQRAIRSLSQVRAKTQFICNVQLTAAKHRAALKESKKAQVHMEQRQRAVNSSFACTNEEAIDLVHRYMQCGRRNDGKAMRVLKEVLGARRKETARQELMTLREKVRAARAQRENARLSPELLRQEKREWVQGCRRQNTLSEDSLRETYSLDTEYSFMPNRL